MPVSYTHLDVYKRQVNRPLPRHPKASAVTSPAIALGQQRVLVKIAGKVIAASTAYGT